MDRIDQLVECAINYTSNLLETTPMQGEAALRGLERMLLTLTRGDPRHPASGRLREFLDELAHRACSPTRH